MAISSTDCRGGCAGGRPDWYLVPDGVVQYIYKRRLPPQRADGQLTHRLTSCSYVDRPVTRPVDACDGGRRIIASEMAVSRSVSRRTSSTL